MKLCPYCDKEMAPAATVCPHCGRDWKSGVSHLSAGAPYAAGRRSRPFLTQGQTIAAVYLLIVAVGLVASSGPPREMPSQFALPIVIYLTMPLSFLISFLFAWSLIHGASVGPMLVMLATSGLTNAFLIAWRVDRLNAADARRRGTRSPDGSNIT
jgi:hypothetical protein